MRKADRSRKESMRRQKLLAAQAKPTATEAGEVNALVDETFCPAAANVTMNAIKGETTNRDIIQSFSAKGA
jgi:hypothetical protein